MYNQFQVGDIVRLKPDQPIEWSIPLGVPLEVKSISGSYIGVPCTYTNRQDDQAEIEAGLKANWGHACFELVERPAPRIYKFRVGDKVIRVSGLPGYWTEGQTGTVTQVEKTKFLINGSDKICSYGYWELISNASDTLSPEESKALIASALEYGTNKEVADDQERIGNADQVSEDRVAVS